MFTSFIQTSFYTFQTNTKTTISVDGWQKNRTLDSSYTKQRSVHKQYLMFVIFTWVTQRREKESKKTIYRYKNKHKAIKSIWTNIKRKKNENCTVMIFFVKIYLVDQHRSILINLDVLQQQLLIYQLSNDNQEMMMIYHQSIPLVSSRWNKVFCLFFFFTIIIKRKSLLLNIENRRF